MLNEGVMKFETLVEFDEEARDGDPYFDHESDSFNGLYMIFCSIRPGADQSSKAALCKNAFTKSKLTFGKSAFA